MTGLSSILLIGADEGDFRHTRSLLQEFGTGVIAVDWEPNYHRGMSALLQTRHDAALIDYRLGADNGVELLKAARARGCGTPLIMLTGQTERHVAAEALSAGADDFLVKGEVTATLLERSLRYAVERRRAIELTQHSEGHLSALLENSAEVVTLLDAAGVIVFASQAIERVFGLRPDQVVGRSSFEHIHPDDLTRIRREFNHCLATPATRFPTHYRAKHADGTWRLCEVVAVNRLDNPAVRAVVLNYRDVTEHKRIEACLVKSEADYRATFENAPIGMAHTRLDGRWLHVNERLRLLLGYSEEQFQSSDFPSLTHPEDVELNIDAREQLLAGAISRYAVEKRYRRADGDYVWVNVTVSLHRDDSGEAKHFIATVEDISERKHAQQELKHIFDLSPDMICTASYEGFFTRTNPAFTKALGYTAEQLQSQQFLSFVHDDDHAATARELGRLAEGETTFGFSNRYRTASGSYRLIEWHAKADTDARLIYAIARDQTDRRLLEDQFRQAQKMEAVGRLAGGVAHDFNNLLTAILGFGEMTMEQLPEGDPLRKDVAHILHAGHSATALTKQLLAFSRKQILDPQVLDLNALVSRMQPMLRRLIGEDVELLTSLDQALLRINADPGQVEQVIMNLAVNARDAMPMGGQLQIATDMVDLDARFVSANPGAIKGHYVRLTLTDSGVGMDPDVLAHLFEPFFTTKEQGKGTGLGLATVYGIVKQSGGYISVKSAEGHGTTFVVHFPSVQRAADTVPDTDLRPHALNGTETILVVEDQREVREVIKHVLVRQGYSVIEAADGTTALELLRARDQAVDLLLTDVVMPVMSGRDLVARLDNRDVAIRVLYMSGYTDDEIVKHGVLDPDIDFLPKPFQPQQLLTRVREVLDRPVRPASS